MVTVVGHGLVRICLFDETIQPNQTQRALDVPRDARGCDRRVLSRCLIRTDGRVGVTFLLGYGSLYDIVGGVSCDCGGHVGREASWLTVAAQRIGSSLRTRQVLGIFCRQSTILCDLSLLYVLVLHQQLGYLSLSATGTGSSQEHHHQDTERQIACEL
jgi:hypothetical protein